jgi:hypothetical protein
MGPCSQACCSSPAIVIIRCPATTVATRRPQQSPASPVPASATTASHGGKHEPLGRPHAGTTRGRSGHKGTKPAPLGRIQPRAPHRPHEGRPRRQAVGTAQAAESRSTAAKPCHECHAGPPHHSRKGTAAAAYTGARGSRSSRPAGGSELPQGGSSCCPPGPGPPPRKR